MQLLTGIILVLSLIVLFYITVALLLYFTQEAFFFYPTKLSPKYPFKQFPSHEELNFNTPNNGMINALLFKASTSKGLVLYSHGNSRSLDDWGWVHEDFVPHGYDLLVYDYRTFGKSTGKLNENNLYEDARFILNEQLKNYPLSEVIIYGRSLGCSIATQLATEFEVRCLILETPFSSMLSMAQRSTPYIPVKYVLRYKFNNKRKMKNLLCPVHIIHGTHDELISLRHAKRLRNSNSNTASTLTIIEGGTHNNLTQFEAYHDMIKKILST